MLPHNTADHILHSTNCKNFCGGPPQQQISTTYEFRSCKRKLLNTLAAPFCRFSSPKIAETPTDHNRSSQSEVAAHSKGRPTSQKLAPNDTSNGHRVANVDTSRHTKQLAKVFKSPWENHLGKCKKPPRSVQQKITWSERFQRAHSKVQARSSRKTTTSTRVRASGTV